MYRSITMYSTDATYLFAQRNHIVTIYVDGEEFDTFTLHDISRDGFVQTCCEYLRVVGANAWTYANAM